MIGNSQTKRSPSAKDDTFLCWDENHAPAVASRDACTWEVRRNWSDWDFRFGREDLPQVSGSIGEVSTAERSKGAA
jgi:hypothetical protein